MDREEEEEEEEMRKIEREITELAERVSRYRSTLPRHLVISQTISASSLIPPAADVASSSSTEGVPLVEEDQETTERTKVLKQKISDNISAVPVLLKRVKNVISRFDKLDSCNIVVPPVYKKKRMS